MTPDATATRPGRAVTGLVVLIAALAAVAAALGLAGAPDPVTVRTVRGSQAVLFGEGVYAHDTVFIGAGNRGTDAITLVLGIPVLLVAAWRARAGSLRWTLVLPGALAWFLYVYATLAVGAAFNALFLVYTVLFSASLYGFVLSLGSARRLRMSVGSDDRSTSRFTAVFLMVTGVVTSAVWLGPVLTAQLAGQLPERLDMVIPSRST